MKWIVVKLNYFKDTVKEAFLNQMYVRAALCNIFYHNIITSLMKVLQYCFFLKQLSPCIEMVKLRKLLSILSIDLSREVLMVLDWGTY